MRKIFIAVIVVVLIVVITGGVIGYTYLQGQNQTPSNPAQTTNEIENIRDQALTYIAANHTQTFTSMPTGHWSGGRVDQPGLVGAVTYQYTNGNWQIEMHYPVVPNPIYTINCTASGLSWSGTYEGGVINETACNLAADTTLTREQMRDLALMYLQGTHNETSSYMHDMNWQGGRVDQGMMLGSDKYNYMGNGWNVTIHNVVVLHPSYTVTAVYTPSNMNSAMMTWVGSIINGTITEASYQYNP